MLHTGHDLQGCVNSGGAGPVGEAHSVVNECSNAQT